MKFKEFRCELDKHLKENILRYWVDKAFDYENNRLYGMVTDDLERNTVKTSYNKTSILCSRTLWVFSTAYKKYKKEEYKKCAYICYDNLINDFYDNKNGGVIWSLDYEETINKLPHERYKHLYSESFAIYGLCAFYSAFKEDEALKKALEIYDKIIEKCTDNKNGGFFENMDEKWEKTEKYALAPKTVDCTKTMNTTLHFMEALTPLYEITKDERVKKTIIEVLDIIFDKMLTDKKDALKMFFDDDYTCNYDAFSPGHDIETSWLIVKCAQAIGDKKYLQKSYDLAIRIAKKVIEVGIDKNYSVKIGIGTLYKDDIWKKYGRDWWSYAEAILGYFNVYEVTGDYFYYKICLKIWNAAKEQIIDEKNGCWKGFFCYPNLIEYMRKIHMEKHNKEPNYNYICKISPWHCCYHNTRMCFEIIDRLENK